MRIVFGVLLVVMAFVWAAFWSPGAAMTTETGVWNSGTSAIMGVASLGLMPLAGGVYLFVRAVRRPKRTG